MQELNIPLINVQIIALKPMSRTHSQELAYKERVPFVYSHTMLSRGVEFHP